MNTKKTSWKSALQSVVLTIGLVMLTLVSNSQSQMPVTLVLQPPYSSNYSAYENLANRAIITLINGNQALDVVLHGSLTNMDRDFSLFTNETYTAGAFTLAAGETKVIINDFRAMRFLARNNVEHSGVPAETWAQMIQKDQLPEGQYELCVNAFQALPTGGVGSLLGSACFTFYLTQAQPPVITSPINGQELNPQQPNTVFAWTPPIGNTLGATIVYDLYVVKVLKGQNPNEAINGAVNYKANNPLIKTNLTSNQYVTQPYDLTIDSNTLYAAQVIARDVNKRVSFKNNGKSEIVTFTKGKTLPIITATIIPPPKKEEKINPSVVGSYPVTNMDPVPFSQVKGKLLYRFKDESAGEILSGKQPTNAQAGNIKIGNIGEGEKDDNLIYNKDPESLGNAKPLAGKKVSLVITYVMSGSLNGAQVNGVPIPKDATYLPQTAVATADKVIATTITGNDGSFVFNFANFEKELGLIDKNYSANLGIEISDKAKGKLFKVLRIRVEDKYYLSPDVNIKVNPWEGIDLGSMISFVKSYTLKVKVKNTNAFFWETAYGTGTPLPGINTSVIRNATVAGIPSNEGYMPAQKDAKPPVIKISASSSKTLATRNTDKDGNVTFYHLVQHDPNNNSDKYYIGCTPSKDSGDFIFKKKEKSYYPLYDKDKAQFPFNSTANYTKQSGGFNINASYGEHITWNHQLVIKTYTTEIELTPDNPRIAGEVKVAKNAEAKKFSNVKVVMINKFKNNTDPSKLFTVVKTNPKGEYEFNNLPVETGEINTKGATPVVGPERKIITKPDGFNAASLPGGPGMFSPMKWGQQMLHQDLLMYPDGRFSGIVEDEKGNPVEADIDIDGLIKTTTKVKFVVGSAKGPGGIFTPSSKQTFDVAAPSGKRKITVTPTDVAYAVLDTSLTIQQDDKKQNTVKLVVLRAQKRIQLRIVETPPGHKGKPVVGTSNLKGVAGANVTITNLTQPISQKSDKDGYVNFVFDNMSDHFEFEIEPAENSNFENTTYSIGGVNNELKLKNYGAIYLKKAASVSGLVTFGPDNKPLENANVYIDLGGGKKLETFTNGKGEYTLNKVPKAPATKTIWAAKSGQTPNLISASKSIVLSENNTIDFNLAIDYEIQIDKIFGFDVEIKSKTKQKDGTWVIDGNLINLPENENFELKDKKMVIPFSNLKIKKSGNTKNNVPLGVPVENSFTTDIADINLILQKSFTVVQRPTTGDLMKIEATNQRGALKGKITITKASFSFTNNYINFNEKDNDIMLLTDKPGSVANNLPSIDAGSVSAKKFGLTNLQGKPLTYTLLGFNASASAEGSWVQGNRINLQTLIKISAIPGMSPSSIEINAGDLIIHPDGFEELNGDKPIKFNLEKWTFTGNNWQLHQSSSSISIATGTVNTGSIDVPVSNISLRPNKIDINNFDIKNLSMGGILPIEVVTPNPVFGYNPNTGKDKKAHYELRLVGNPGQPGVIIKSLPGMKPGDAFKFQNYSITSDGDQVLNPGNQPNDVTLYSIMKVRPFAFSSGSNYVNMTSGVDLNIPQVPEGSAIIQFAKEAGKITLKLYPINVSVKAPGDVDFTADLKFDNNPQTLSEGLFTALGSITDKEGIKLKGVLTKNTTGAFIKVDPENQLLPLGGGNTSMKDIKGKLDADMSNGTWGYFTFSGELSGFNGVEGNKRKTFTVTGSINASNEKLEVKNIPSGFGDIGITYDIANSRFTGNLEIDKNIGPLAMKGTASLLFDPGGWYFLAGGNLKTPGLGEFSAGLLIGNYNSMPGDVSQKLMQYAYDKSVPSSFKNGISGFFFTGMKDLPVINIPDYSIDLVVISASFGAKAGVDARLWMDFAKTGNEYGIGAMVFTYAYLKGASITCTKFGAEARAELGVKGTYTTSNGAFTLKGCGSFTISGSVKQCIPTPCWSDGICCTNCAGVSKSVGIKIDLLLDSKGNTDFSFGFGNCSGQPAMESNW